MAKAATKKTAAVKSSKKKPALTKARKKKAAPAKASTKTTESVLRHHEQALFSRKLDELIKDYCEESVVCTPLGIARGLKEIRDTFASALSMLTPEALANMKTMTREVNGDYAYILWTALPVVPFGGDTFHVHDGKIMLQTFVGQINR